MKKTDKTRRRTPLLGFLLLFCTTIFGQIIPLDPAVRTGKLPNGFKYFIRHNAEPRQRVILYLANKVGSMQEEDDQRGLAHFIEHMSFNGTKKYPKNTLVEYLEKAGIRFGADLNAYTAFTETVYQLPLPSDDTAILRNGLQIMREWAGEALLETEEIDKERGVVVEEKRLRSGLSARLQDKYFPLQVNNTRYANRLPIGTDDVLHNFTPDAVKRFYKDWYRPNQQALIVVGDINVDSMEIAIRKLFSDLKNPPKERAVETYNIPLTGKNQFLAMSDPEQTTTQLSIQFKRKEIPLKTAADLRYHMIRSLLNQAISGRLNELSMKPEPPFVMAQASLAGFMGGLNAFSVSIVPKPRLTREAFTQVWAELVRLQQWGITKSELDRSKLAYLSHMDNVYRERAKIPSDAYVQDYLSYFLKDVAAPGIEKEHAIARKDISTITIAEVNALARNLITDTDRDILVFSSEKDKSDLPSEAEMNEWIRSINQMKLTAWKDETGDKKLFALQPVPGKVVSSVRIDSVGVNIYTLSNGVRVWVKPTNFKNDEILFSAFSEGGMSLYADSLFLQASAAGSLIPANGLDVFGPVELGKLLTGKTAQVQPYIQDLYEGLNGSTVPKDLETALQLVHLQFTKPRYDTMLFNNNINAARAMMANRSNSPETLFNDTVNWIMGDYHYRRRPPSPTQFDSIDIDKAFAIYKERFANAADFVFIFTGNIDTAVFLPLLERYIGSLPATDHKEHLRDLGMSVPTGRINKTIYKGKENKAVVKLCYSGDYTFNTGNNIKLNALGAVLQYRMTERIREAEGGAYTPRAGVYYAKLPRSRYIVSIDFTCAPENAEKLVAAATEEIKKLQKNGALQDDVEKFKAEQIRMREMQLQQNGFWHGWLNYSLLNNLQPTAILNFRTVLNTVTPELVKSAAQQFINDENYIRIMLMPEP